MKKYFKYALAFGIIKKAVILIFLLSNYSFAQTAFKEGFEAGYKKGYCFNIDYNCIIGVIPLAPLPPIGKRTYNDGYNIGFLRGKSASSNSGGNNQSSNTYQKYRDAYKYQSGGAEEQRMVGDAVDAALEEGRLRRQRAAQRRASQSNYNSSAIDYALYNSGLKKFEAENYRGAILCRPFLNTL